MAMFLNGFCVLSHEWQWLDVCADGSKEHRGRLHLEFCWRKIASAQASLSILKLTEEQQCVGRASSVSVT